MAVAGGVLTLFVRNVSFDDVYYVNKAVFVAEHGTIPMRDTIYTDQVLPAIRGAGTVPVQSFEVFQGAVAHLVGISGGTVVYLLTPPVVIALCVWVMWWLARTWSSGPALAAFAVAVAYLTFGIYVEPGAEGSIAMSSIPLRAAWQGKVVLLCVALPMAYLALSRWALHRRLRDLVLVVAVGAAAVGLSSTAAFLVPPVALAAAFALLLTRRPGWLGALALGAYPLGAGLVASALGDGAGYGELLRTAPEAYHGVLGRGPWGWLGSLALLLGAWGVRRGAARSVAAAAAVGAVVLLAPFMPELVQDVTGAGPLVWRLPWVIPVPVLLGVLAAAPVAVARGWPARSEGSARPRGMPSAALRVLGWVPFVVVLAVVVATGRTVWDPLSPNEMASRPVWKFPAVELDRAARVAERARGLDGPVLAPRLAMSAMALTTTDVHAVDPRSFFLPSIVEDLGQNAARRRLSSDMRPVRATRVLPTFGTDLDRLGCCSSASTTDRSPRVTRWPTSAGCPTPSAPWTCAAGAAPPERVRRAMGVGPLTRAGRRSPARPTVGSVATAPRTAVDRAGAGRRAPARRRPGAGAHGDRRPARPRHRDRPPAERVRVPAPAAGGDRPPARPAAGRDTAWCGSPRCGWKPATDEVARLVDELPGHARDAGATPDGVARGAARRDGRPRHGPAAPRPAALEGSAAPRPDRAWWPGSPSSRTTSSPTAWAGSRSSARSRTASPPVGRQGAGGARAVTGARPLHPPTWARSRGTPGRQRLRRCAPGGADGPRGRRRHPRARAAPPPGWPTGAASSARRATGAGWSVATADLAAASASRARARGERQRRRRHGRDRGTGRPAGSPG